MHDYPKGEYRKSIIDRSKFPAAFFNPPQINIIEIYEINIKYWRVRNFFIRGFFENIIRTKLFFNQSTDFIVPFIKKNFRAQLFKFL